MSDLTEKMKVEKNLGKTDLLTYIAFDIINVFAIIVYLFVMKKFSKRLSELCVINVELGDKYQTPQGLISKEDNLKIFNVGYKRQTLLSILVATASIFYACFLHLLVRYILESIGRYTEYLHYGNIGMTVLLVIFGAFLVAPLNIVNCERGINSGFRFLCQAFINWHEKFQENINKKGRINHSMDNGNFSSMFLV